MITTVARHEVRVLRRQRVLAAIVGTLLVTTAVAGVLGWSSQRTIVKVFAVATRLLADTGQTTPPNPFVLKPSLSLLSNMVVYVPLIGALLALLLGHLSLVEEESGGLGRLLFSRRMSRSQYAAGKVASAAMVLAGTLLASLFVSVGSVLVVNRNVTGSELARLALFYGLSWVYLLTFALIGMIPVLLTRHRSLALLAGMGVWLVITFAIPQFTAGLRPTQSLNPIVEPIGLSQPLFRLTAHAQPFSVVEQYKSASSVILGTAPAEPVLSTVTRVLPAAGLMVLLALLLFRLVAMHDYSRTATDE